MIRDCTSVQIVRERDLYLPKGASLKTAIRGTSEYGEDIYVVTAVVKAESEDEADALMKTVQSRVERVLS